MKIQSKHLNLWTFGGIITAIAIVAISVASSFKKSPGRLSEKPKLMQVLPIDFHFLIKNSVLLLKND